MTTDAQGPPSEGGPPAGGPPEGAATEGVAGDGAGEPSFDVVRRGFDREQVLGHLRTLGERVRDLEERATRAEAALAEARRGDPADRDPMERVAEHVRGLVEGFDQEVDRQRRKAELEATVMLAEARTEAAQLRLDARAAEEESVAEAQRLLRVAREEAATIRGEALSLREAALTEVRAIHDRMRSSLRELEAGLVGRDVGDRVIVLAEPAEGGHLPDVPPARRAPA
jgi:hypothetical protein